MKSLQWQARHPTAVTQLQTVKTRKSWNWSVGFVVH